MIKSITLVSAQDNYLVSIYFSTLNALNMDINFFNGINNHFKHRIFHAPIIVFDNPTFNMPISKIQPYISELYEQLHNSKIEHDLYVYSNNPLVIDFFYGKDIKIISLEKNGFIDVTDKILHLNENFTLSDIFAKGWEVPVKS
jgi:hypothetical protein